MSDADYSQIADRVLAAVSDPGFPGRLAAEVAARTDPWRWYCRLCSATGAVGHTGDATADSCARDALAREHLATTRCGRHDVLGWQHSGRLLHVWTYPRGVIAQYS